MILEAQDTSNYVTDSEVDGEEEGLNFLKLSAFPSLLALSSPFPTLLAPYSLPCFYLPPFLLSLVSLFQTPISILILLPHSFFPFSLFISLFCEVLFVHSFSDFIFCFIWCFGFIIFIFMFRTIFSFAIFSVFYLFIFFFFLCTVYQQSSHLLSSAWLFSLFYCLLQQIFSGSFPTEVKSTLG